MKDWKNITNIELRELYYEQKLNDSEIAKLYDVSKSAVKYKRRKFSITLEGQIYYSMLKNSPELIIANNMAKKRLLNPENINKVAKALTVYLFRNGVVEDMHSQHKLSDEDMKKLNIYFANHLAGLLTAAYRGSWIQLEAICARFLMDTSEWEDPTPNTKQLDIIIKALFNKKSIFPITIQLLI